MYVGEPMDFSAQVKALKDAKKSPVRENIVFAYDYFHRTNLNSPTNRRSIRFLIMMLLDGSIYGSIGFVVHLPLSSIEMNPIKF